MEGTDKALITWNRHIILDETSYGSVYDLNDLNLELYDLSGNLLDFSTSSIDNIEQIEAPSPQKPVVVKVSAEKYFNSRSNYENYAFHIEQSYSEKEGPKFVLTSSAVPEVDGSDIFIITSTIKNTGDLGVKNLKLRVKYSDSESQVVDSASFYTFDLDVGQSVSKSFKVKVSHGWSDVGVSFDVKMFNVDFASSSLDSVYYCEPNVVNSSWSGWNMNSECRPNDTFSKVRSKREYDLNNCGKVEDKYYYEYIDASCDFCTPNPIFNSFSEWEDVDVCHEGDFFTQIRYAVSYDSNICYSKTKLESDVFESVLINETRNVDCNFCSPNLVNTSWSPLSLACYSGGAYLSKKKVQYDSNFCDVYENKSFYDGEVLGFNWKNTSWSEWNVSSCLKNDSLIRKRQKVQFDGFGCGENVTFVEEESDVCDFCLPLLEEVKMCLENESIKEFYQDLNNCYLLTNLSSDFILKNETLRKYSCDFDGDGVIGSVEEAFKELDLSLNKSGEVFEVKRENKSFLEFNFSGVLNLSNVSIEVSNDVGGESFVLIRNLLLDGNKKKVYLPNLNDYGKADVGFIAEEISEVIPEITQYDGEGEISGLNYRHYTAVLTKAVQELNDENIRIKKALCDLNQEDFC